MTLKANQAKKERRKAQRHPCSIEVGCATPDVSFVDYIADINCWGVFLQSTQQVPVGDSVIMTIPIMEGERSIRVVGEVMWNSPQGMGVQFNMGIDASVLDNILSG